MSRQRSREHVVTWTLLGIAFALGACASSTPEVALATWDQDRVAAIAQKLVPATEALYTTYYEQPLNTSGTGGGHEFKDTIRLMRLESKHFADELAAGKGHDATRSVYFRIKELNDDAVMYGRRLFEVDSTLNQFAAVEDLVRQLAPYYDHHWQSQQQQSQK